MIRFLVLVLCCLFPVVAGAATVVVKSGEHDGFTRLVMDFGAPVDWTLGRSLDGYALHLGGPAATYDLTEAFALIGKGRLAAIWADPDSNDLRVGIACACHAMPFEFRPGIIVIDLKDGPPPKGSSFELALDGTPAPEIAGRNAIANRPKPRPEPTSVGYDWLKRAAIPSGRPRGDTGTPAVLSDATFEPLRESLLWQMSKGAAEGVVDMTVPSHSISEPQGVHGAAVEMRMGEDAPANLRVSSETLAAQGQPCISNEALDIASWGSDLPIADQLAARVDGLIGEFDRPDPEAVAKAVRLNLYLGFGAESRQLLNVFPVAAADSAIWNSLAHLLDDDRIDSGVFDDLAACDTAAALWAVLSKGGLAKGDQVNAKAILLAFSNLPLHLRQQLAPRLTDRFLAMQDQNSARAVRDAVLRAPGQDGNEMALVAAKIDMQDSDAKSAEATLAPVLADPGTAAPMVLAAYVESRVAQDLPIKPDLVVVLEGLVRETPEGKDRERIQNALVLAQAASGDFDAAFEGLPTSKSTGPDLWRLLAILGTDASILNHAIVADGDSPVIVDHAIGQALALRLLDLGFPKPAAVWLTKVDDPDPVLAAKVALKSADARAALRALAGINTEEAGTLRRAALGQLGDDKALADIYALEGDGAAQSAALARAGDWQSLADLNAGPWQTLATTLKSSSGEPSIGPLAAAHQLAEASTQTQSAAIALLEVIPMPAQP